MIDFVRTIYAVLEGFAGKTDPPEVVEAAIAHQVGVHYAERPALRLIKIEIHRDPGRPYTISFGGLAADDPVRIEFYGAWIQVMMEKSAALAGMAAGYQLRAERLLRQGIIEPGEYTNGAARFDIIKDRNSTCAAVTVGGIRYTWHFDEAGKRT